MYYFIIESIVKIVRSDFINIYMGEYTMLNEKQFNEIKERANLFQYTSFQYLEYEECKNLEILCYDSNVIIVLDKGILPLQLHFATNNFLLLIESISRIKEELQINFVPYEYQEELQKIGFFPWAEYIDYFNNDLDNTEITHSDYSEISFLEQHGCREVSLLSKRCANQSRGFMGETEQWFSDWLHDNDVIILRKDNKIVGFCCVSIYNNGMNLWIREVAVAPTYQGQGLGKILIEQAICYGIHKGAVKGFLAADVLNENAIKLYMKYGFEGNADRGELQMRRKSIIV